MKKGTQSACIKMIEAKLKDKKLENLFMHGTGAAVPRTIVESPNLPKLNRSKADHDFGRGLCH